MICQGHTHDIAVCLIFYARMYAYTVFTIWSVLLLKSANSHACLEYYVSSSPWVHWLAKYLGLYLYKYLAYLANIIHDYTYGILNMLSLLLYVRLLCKHDYIVIFVT